MRKNSRIGKTLKCTGVLALGLLLAAWIFSTNASFYYINERFIIGLTAGRIDVQWRSGDLANGFLSWRPDFSNPAFMVRPALNQSLPEKITGFMMDHLQDRRPVAELLGLALPGFQQHAHPAYGTAYGKRIGPATTRCVVVPFWLLFVVALAPTLWLFWRDRTYPPGFCQACRYDLRGSCAHRCPECGTPVPEWLQANPTRT